MTATNTWASPWQPRWGRPCPHQWTATTTLRGTWEQRMGPPPAPCEGANYLGQPLAAMMAASHNHLGQPTTVILG